jgi:hypothetical protein
MQATPPPLYEEFSAILQLASTGEELSQQVTPPPAKPEFSEMVQSIIVGEEFSWQ